MPTELTADEVGAHIGGFDDEEEVSDDGDSAFYAPGHEQLGEEVEEEWYVHDAEKGGGYSGERFGVMFLGKEAHDHEHCDEEEDEEFALEGWKGGVLIEAEPGDED